MPNWCNNSITLRHADPTMIDRVIRGQEGLLMEFIPTPQALVDTMSGSYGDEEKQKLLEAKELDNLAKYGYKNWYDWNIANWGTKWDVTLDSVEQVDANTVTASFESAWAPPIDAYHTLMELGFEIEAFYYEPGMAFVGKWNNGDDDYHEYAGCTSENVREQIGAELDDYFGISDDMAQWEEENETEE